MKRLALTIACTLATSWPSLLVAVDIPPYGSREFVPTPETPIGYRADGNGYYPGATPLLEWWEGTPVQKDTGVAGSNSRYDPRSSRDKRQKVWSLGDTTSKNLLWKSPIPGWGDAQPIVVGDRVIACCDPDVTICYDANTGTVLWQDRLLVMTLPAIGQDRKTLEPAPDATSAKSWQRAWELARAVYLMWVQAANGRPDKGPDADATWPNQKPQVERCLQRVKDWQANFAKDLPQPTQDGLAKLAGVYQGLLQASDGAAREKLWGDLRKNPYLTAFDRSSAARLGTTAMEWQGHVGGSFSTPVSDGRLVVVCFAYGQVGAYEVATGQRVWALRDALVPRTQHMNHGASPWMCRDLVLVRSGDGQAIMGLDKATGALRWETQIQMQKRGSGANHGNYVTPVLMDVPVKEGGVRPVLVTQNPPVLDPLTGEVLGNLRIGKGRKDGGGAETADVVGTLPSEEKKPRSDRGSMVGADGLLFSCWGYDASPSPCYRHRLSFAGGKLVIEALGELPGSPGNGANALLLRPEVLLGDGSSWFDPATGAKLGALGQTSEGAPGVLCGDLLIVRTKQNSFNRQREDFAVTAAFAVIDLKDPRQPKLVRDTNLLGGDELPNDPIFDTYLTGFDKKVNVGCYLGLCPWFGCRVGGVVPKGDRLYIQSSVGMYCIAPPGSLPLRAAVAR